MSLSLKVTPKKLSKLASKSFVYVAPADFQELCGLARTKAESPEVQTHGVYVQIKGIAFSVMPSELVELGSVYFNMANRQTAMVPFHAEVVLTPLTKASDFMYLKSLTIEVGYFRTDEKTRRTLDCDIAAGALKKDYIRHFFNRGQVFYMHLKFPDKVAMRLTVRDVEGLSTDIVGASSGAGGGGGAGSGNRGILQPETEIKFIKAPQHPLVLENSNQNQAQDMFAMQELSFSSMGIGGLDGQFGQIFRRAFASRLFPPDYMKKLGLTHVKGILM